MNHRIAFLGVAAICAFLDLLSKHLAFTYIPENGPDVKVIDGIFSFGRTTNKGIVFGLFQGAGTIFLIVSVLAVPAILAIYYSLKKPRWIITISLALILGGTVGNMYDRVKDREVRDFIKFYWKDKTWPLFNLADSYICVGVALLSIEMLFFEEKKKKPQEKGLSTAEIAVGPTEPMAKADPPPATPSGPTEPMPPAG